MGRQYADKRSKAATRTNHIAKIHPINRGINLPNNTHSRQRMQEQLSEDGEFADYPSSSDDESERIGGTEFDDVENGNPSRHQDDKVTKQLSTEEWELVMKIRKNELSGIFPSSNSLLNDSFVSRSSSYSSASTLTNSNSSSSKDSSRNRQRDEVLMHERSTLEERYRPDMTSGVDFSNNTWNRCSSHTPLNTDSDRLMLSDLGVNREIMEVIDGKPHFAGIRLRGTVKPWYVKIDGKEYPVNAELDALSKVCYSIQALDMESPINPERLNICSRKKIVAPPSAMVEPARASCNRGESVEFVETYLLHPRLFAIMLRSRGDDVAGPKGGGQSIRKYLAKLASNNLGSMTKRLKSTSLLDFLSSEMQGKFLEGVAGIRRALIDAGNPDIRPKPYISNLRHMQIVAEESSTITDNCKYQTILEALTVKLGMWKYENEYYEKNTGAEYLTLTTAANEAFVLGCLFEISAGKRNFSNSGAFKAANMVKDLVKECRKNTATNEDDREYFRDQRKQMFRDWGIFGKKSRRARDTSGKFARFSGTGNDVEEEQEQMLSLEALEENE